MPVTLNAIGRTGGGYTRVFAPRCFWNIERHYAVNHRKNEDNKCPYFIFCHYLSTSNVSYLSTWDHCLYQDWTNNIIRESQAHPSVHQ